MKKNNALYYPFSRCLDDTILKQNLLIFDSITFLDPVDNEDWRKELFRDLEEKYKAFKAYRDIAKIMPWLRENKIVNIVNPENLHSLQSDLVTASTLSDLGDQTWIKEANPQRYHLPMERNHKTGEPVWNVFSNKMPSKFMEALTNETLLSQHLFYDGRDEFAWELSYAAGSSIGINVHLAAAEELGLAPVTDSTLHHNLLLMKLLRKKNDNVSYCEISDYVEHTTNQSLIKIINEVLPRNHLENLSISDIIQFRDDTKEARNHFLEEIKNDVINKIDFEKGTGNFFLEEVIKSKVLNQMKNYGDELSSVRDRLWPKIIDGLTTPVPVATSLAGVAGSFILGSGYVLGASLLLHALQPLKVALDWKADMKKITNSACGAVAYLSQVKSLS